MKNIYGDKALKKMRLYGIIRKVEEEKQVSDQRLFNSKRKVRDTTFITKVASDKGGATRKLAQPHGVSTKKIHATLHENVDLSKKVVQLDPKSSQRGDARSFGDGPRTQLSERALMVSEGTVERDKWPRGEVVFFYS
jgi:hypothetical protein